MRPTPTLPKWLKNYRHPAYTNIYELCPSESRVFGTEALFGDWDAELLFLAKDYAPSAVIQARIDAGDPHAFRAGDPDLDGPAAMGVKTNENLKRLAGLLPDVPMLYGSALGGLMRNDDQTSGALPDFQSVLDQYAVPLLRWCISELPALRGIACLGDDACAVLEALTGTELRGHPRGQGVSITVEDRKLIGFRLFHTSRPFAGGWRAREAEWQAMARTLVRRTTPAPGSVAKRSVGFVRAGKPAAARHVIPKVLTGKGPVSAASSVAMPGELKGWLPGDHAPLLTGQQALDPGSTAGKHVFLATMASPNGASIPELWSALRRHRVQGWDTASKFKGGFGVLREMGWGWWVARATGRIYAYKAPSDLAGIRRRAG